MTARSNVRAGLDATLAEVAEWTTAEDEALVGALRVTADQLDASYSDRTMAEYLRGIKDLYARKDQRISEMPPLERVWRSMDGSGGPR